MPELKTLGWREWVRLPELGIQRIKAKVDTGARSSCLHAYDVKVVDGDSVGGSSRVRFKVVPRQGAEEPFVQVEATLLEYREIRSSTGHKTNRPVIRTPIRVAGRLFEIDLTLDDRSEMGFRMLLGREALRGRFTVDPARSYAGRKAKRKTQNPDHSGKQEN